MKHVFSRLPKVQIFLDPSKSQEGFDDNCQRALRENVRSIGSRSQAHTHPLSEGHCHLAADFTADIVAQTYEAPSEDLNKSEQRVQSRMTQRCCDLVATLRIHIRDLIVASSFSRHIPKPNVHPSQMSIGNSSLSWRESRAPPGTYSYGGHACITV